MTILRKINQFMEDLYSAGILISESKWKGNYKVKYSKTDSIENSTTIVILNINFCGIDKYYFNEKVEQVIEALNDEFPSEAILDIIPDKRFCGSMEIRFKRRHFKY